MYTRKQTKSIHVGKLIMGGSDHIIIQSMTNTSTKNIQETVNQIRQLENLGCELIRLAVLDFDDAHAISEIKKQVKLPIVADIHFDYRLALAAIDAGADKIRINPGNIGGHDKLALIVEKCRKNNIPIRIGINGGSLEKDLEDKFGHNSAQGLYESAKRNIQLIESLDYHEIVVSLKSSDVITTIEAYQLLAQEYNYPLHLGITEAGTLMTSSVRSSVGIGVLLYLGIGDTIRVSITGTPINEIIVAKELLSSLHLYDRQYPKIIACPTCGRTKINIEKITNEISTYLHQINKNVTVAIMGCIVNGPGEAKNADIGIAGGNQEAVLFKKGTIIRKIHEEDIIEVLKSEIEKM